MLNYIKAIKQNRGELHLQIYFGGGGGNRTRVPKYLNWGYYARICSFCFASNGSEQQAPKDAIPIFLIPQIYPIRKKVDRVSCH